jgi:hypothetical protein
VIRVRPVLPVPWGRLETPERKVLKVPSVRKALQVPLA